MTGKKLIPSLHTVLKTLAPRIAGTDCRAFPSGFEPDDADLVVFPQSLGWHWESCEQALQLLEPRVLMTRLPAFWQLEPPLHSACRAAGCPILINDSNNMPVGAAALYGAEVDMVVTDAADAAMFSSFLSAKNVPMPPKWFVIHRIDATSWEIPAPLANARGTRVVQEVHALPGCPVLFQCRALAAEKKSAFHISSGYRLDDSGAFLVGDANEIVPAHRIDLRYPLVSSGLCSCGQEIVTRKKI